MEHEGKPQRTRSNRRRADWPIAFNFREGAAQFRIGLVSFLAAAIGLVAGLVAYALYQLIGLFTNLFFFHRWSTNFTSVRFHHLGPWVILVPVVGRELTFRNRQKTMLSKVLVLFIPRGGICSDLAG